MTIKINRWLDQEHTVSSKLSLECWTHDFWPSAIIFKHWPLVKQPRQKICKENYFIRIVRHSIMQKECFWLGHWDLNEVILRPPFPLLPFLCKDWWAVLFQWYFHRKLSSWIAQWCAVRMKESRVATTLPTSLGMDILSCLNEEFWVTLDLRWWYSQIGNWCTV